MLKLGPKKDQETQAKEMARLAAKINGHECKKCLGRGHDGWNVSLGQYIVCGCVLKAAHKVKMQKRQEVKEQVNDSIQH